MNKNAKALLKSLERSHEAAAVQYSTIKAAVYICLPVEMETVQWMLNKLDAYLKANMEMQLAINAGYGDTPRTIAHKAIKCKSLN